jgi:hypothetical protein
MRLMFVNRLFTVAAVAAVTALFAACTGVSQPVVGPTYDEFGCKVGCDRCAPEAACISAPYVAACVARCDSAADCNVGEKCAVVAGYETRPAVCLAARQLVVCHAPDCQLLARCRDDSTALKPLSAQSTACGWEVVHCDSGCDPTTGNCK